MTILSLEFIASDPQIRNGRPIIAGTSIRVLDIVALFTLEQRTPEDIASGYGLSLAQVHASLAYYYAHKVEIDADLRHEIDLIEKAKEKRLT